MLQIKALTPLCIAIDQNNTDAVLILLRAGANPNFGAPGIGTPLNLAVAKLNVTIVKELIQRGVDVNNPEQETLNTPFHILMTKFRKSSYKAIIIAETLIASGANPNAKNGNGWAPIHFAAKKKSLQAIRWIMEYNKKAKERNLSIFDINLQGGSAKLSALHIAAHSESYEIVKEITANGGDVFSKNDIFRTPRIAGKGNLSIYKYLLKVEASCIKQMVDSYSLTKTDTFDKKANPKLFSNTENNEAEQETLPTLCFKNCSSLKIDLETNTRSIKKSKQGRQNKEKSTFNLINSQNYLGTKKIKNTEKELKDIKNSLLYSGKARMHEKHKEWIYLALNKSFRANSKEMNEILSNLLCINNVGLQLDIIEYTTKIPTDKTIDILGKLLEKNDCNISAALQHGIINAINIIASENKRKPAKISIAIPTFPIKPNIFMNKERKKY